MKDILKHIRAIFTCKEGIYEYQRALLETLENRQSYIERELDEVMEKYSDKDNT
tara:strand:- start:537 stop:698 length:162 start_codon:yes stop_codon:yes gene_type:complete